MVMKDDSDLKLHQQSSVIGLVKVSNQRLQLHLQLGGTDVLPCIYVPFKCNCVAILDRGRISFMHFGLKLKIRFAMVSITNYI